MIGGSTAQKLLEPNREAVPICVLSVKKVFGKISKKKITGKYLCQSRPATLLKKRLWHRCFLVIFAKILRIPPVAASGNRKFFIIFQLLASKLLAYV